MGLIEQARGYLSIASNMKLLMNDVQKWAKNTPNEQRFKDNLHADIQTRTKGKFGLKDATEKQIASFKDKWLDARTKGSSKN